MSMGLCQLEFSSHDPDATLTFMREILGWREVPITIQDQAIIEVEPNSTFGISVRRVPIDRPTTPPLVATFRSRGSLENLIQAAQNLGARRVEDVRVLPGYGRTIVIEDNGGVRYGFFQSDTEKAPQ